MLETLRAQILNFSNFDVSNFKEYKEYGIIFVLFLLTLLFGGFFYRRLKKKAIPSSEPKADYLYMNSMVKETKNDFSHLFKTKNGFLEKKIAHNIQELAVFLEVKANQIELQRENFNLEEFISEISKKLSIKDKELNIVTNSDVSYSIITDKHILEAIFTLLSLLQFKEHNLKHAHINLLLQTKEKKLILAIDEGLSFNKHMQKVLEDSTLTPYYNPREDFYYGIYLFLLNKFVSELSGVMTINIIDKIYTVTIELPIAIEEQEGRNSLLIPKETKKELKALVVCDDKTLAQSIAHFLELYNVKVDVINKNKTLQITDFKNYDILFTNKNFLNSVFSEYLLSIKKQHPIKTVVVESPEEKNKYKENLVDFVLKKPIVQSKIYSIILELFKDSQKELFLDNSASSFSSAPALYSTQTVKKEKSSNRKKRVLIADDNIINRNILKAMIENYGVEVITVTNGEDVLSELEKGTEVDLIILDSIMPKLDGYETIKKIRAKEQFNTLPVIIHSSFSLNGKTSSIEDIFKLGFDSYLPKPFTTEKLESILLRYLHVQPKVKKKEKVSKQDYEEFIAIYGHSDKMLEKYVKEESYKQLESLLEDLKNIAQKIKKEELYHEVLKLQKSLKERGKITLDSITPLVNIINKSKYEVLKELEY